MTKGRKPLPDKIVDLKGRQGYHRSNKIDTPEPPAVIPECPEHFDEEARKEWNRLTSILDPARMITEADRGVIAGACYHWSVWVHATKKISDENLVQKAPSGYPLVNPYLSIAHKAFDKMLKCLIELGCSPSSRSRVKVSAPKKKENKKERFFN